MIRKINFFQNKTIYRREKGFIQHQLIRPKLNRDNIESNHSGGFTLIELLLYMGIFTIFLSITLQMFTSIFDIKVESEAVSSVASDGKYITERFSYDVNRATGVTTPSYYGTTSASLAFTSEGQSLNYSLSNGNLILTNSTSGTTDQLNSNETTVSNLGFIRLDGAGKDAVQVTFTLTSDATKRSGKEVTTFQSSAGIR